jgi:chromosome segregation ATPase
MNTKILSGVLGLVCLGLGVGWFLTTRKAGEERSQSATRVSSLSNEVVTTASRLSEQQKVNVSLSTDLSQREVELKNLSNKWTFVTAELAKSEEEAKAAAEAARLEIEKRDKQIAGLEGEKDALTQKMDGLTTEIGGLNGKIAETERKLAASEGDREQLQKELRRLLAEKAELERKFQDLAVLREQVRKLKEELSISRRLEFIRRGLYGFDKKGGQVLAEGIRAPAKTNAAGTNYQLNVEIGTDGSSKVTPTEPPK